MASPEASTEGQAPAPSDALVFFGATGDLAYKKIFPALQSMVEARSPRVPVIGGGEVGLDSRAAQGAGAREREEHGAGVHEPAFSKLMSRLQYVDGDYGDPATFAALRKALGSAQAATHYLAIPPSLFATVIEPLGALRLRAGARGWWWRSPSAMTSTRRRT